MFVFVLHTTDADADIFIVFPSYEIWWHPAEVDHDIPELRTSAVQAHEVSSNRADMQETTYRTHISPHHILIKFVWWGGSAFSTFL